MKHRRVVELLELVIFQHFVHLGHDSAQGFRRGLTHGKPDKRPRFVLVDETGQTTFPRYPKGRKVSEALPKVGDAVLDPVMLESHDLAEADVRPLNDLGVHSELSEGFGEKVLKDVKVVDGCEEVRSPVAANMLETSDSEFVQAGIVI